jgi:hypothetical protein
MVEQTMFVVKREMASSQKMLLAMTSKEKS